MKKGYLLLLLAWGLFSPGLPAEESLERLPLGNRPERFRLLRLQAGEIADTRSGSVADLRKIIAARFGARVFVIGEAHDSYACHLWQAEFIRELAAAHPKVLVGFEFFNRSETALLQSYLRDEIDKITLLQKTGWYDKGSMAFGLTSLVLDALKEKGLPAIGLNVERELMRKISRGGFASLTKAEQAVFPGIRRETPDHRYFIRMIFSRMALLSPPWFENVYTAQKGWDTVMAESMLQALELPEYKGYKGVIIAGSNHVAYNLGIPWRLRRKFSASAIATFVPLVVRADDSEIGHPMFKMMAKNSPPFAICSAALGDYVFAIDGQADSNIYDWGLKVKESPEGLLAEDVREGSPAAGWGIVRGDILLQIDETILSSKEQLYCLLEEKAGQPLGLRTLKTLNASPPDEKRE